MLRNKPVTVNSRRFVTGLLTLWLACLCTWAGMCAAQDYDLPSLGSPASTVLSPTKAERLGGRVLSRLLQSGRILEDVELRRYLHQVGARLLRPTAHDVDDFRFFMVDTATINAFALPGGYIGVNAGLLLETQSESELAAVMAHEIAHVTQHHIARQIQATQGLQWAPLVAALAAAIASGGDSDAVQAAIVGSMSAIRRQRLGYTRAHEHEADRIGIRMLAAAHFDPDAMASFFETMQDNARLYGRHLPQILLTHPVTTARIAEARARARDYPSTKVIESDDYAIMKERARVLTNSQRSQLLDYYRRLGAPANTPPAKDYGYAITLTRAGRANQAVTILHRLVDSHPGQAHYVLALARAHAANGHIDRALDTLKEALGGVDDAPAVVLEYAATLLDSNQPAAARRVLGQHPRLTGRSYRAQQIQAQAAAQLGKLGEAYYRQALYYQLRGNYVAAIRKLRTALHRGGLTAIDEQRLDALMNRIIDQCKAAWPGDQCRKQVLDRRY